MRSPLLTCDDPTALPGTARTIEEVRAWKPRVSLAVHAQSVWDAATGAIVSVTSHDRVFWCANVASNTAMLAHPLTNGKVLYDLLSTHNPWWASFNFMFMILPVCMLLVGFRAVEAHSAAFEKAFNCTPNAVHLIKIDVRILVKQILGRYSTPEEEALLKLRRLAEGFFGGIPWTIFQVYILWKEAASDVQVVDSSDLLLNSALTAFAAYQAINFLTTYAGLMAGGDIKEFLKILFRLGEGMAPPMVLVRLRTLRHVRITESLESLTISGLLVLGKAIASSKALESCEFRNTNIAMDISRHNSSHEFVRRWGNFVKYLTNNCIKLRHITFFPAVQVETWRYVSDFSPKFQELCNGEEQVYIRDATFPRSSLRDAVDADDEKAFRRAINSGEVDLNAVARLAMKSAARSDSWRVLRVAAADRLVDLYGMSSALLNAATQYGSLRSLELLLWMFPTLELSDPLYFSSQNGNLKAVKFLLSARADPKVTPAGYKNHALSACAFATSNIKGIAMALLQARADPTTCIADGPTPAHLAAQQDQAEMIRVLVQARASPDAQLQNDGSTPLHLAVNTNALAAIRALLAVRAAPETKNKSGRTPLDWAKKKDRTEAAAVLSKIP